MSDHQRLFCVRFPPDCPALCHNDVICVALNVDRQVEDERPHNAMIKATDRERQLMGNKFTQADDFNETRFWTKIVGYAKKAGSEVIEKVLWLYYAAQRPDTPVWAKTTIYAALAYFVLPLDAIPDALPVVGFTDDLGVLAGALGTVSLYVNEEVKQQTRDKLADWFD